jgi:flagellar biosynthesis protein FliR
MNVADLFAEVGVKTNLTLIILTVALLVARILPIIIFSPFLGGETVPNEVRIGLGLTIALVLFPGVSGQVSRVPVSTLPFVMLMLKEVFIGLSLGFIVNMVFDAARAAGHLLDTTAGINMAQVMVPQLQQQATIFSSLQMQLSVVTFLTLNGHHAVINGLADSLLTIPLDRFPQLRAGPWPFFDLILHTFSALLEIGLVLSAPGLLATFLADLALGMINRVAPQIQVFFISMSVKPMVAAVLVLITVHLFLERLSVEFQGMLERFTTAIRLLS